MYLFSPGYNIFPTTSFLYLVTCKDKKNLSLNHCILISMNISLLLGSVYTSGVIQLSICFSFINYKRQHAHCIQNADIPGFYQQFRWSPQWKCKVYLHFINICKYFFVISFTYQLKISSRHLVWTSIVSVSYRTGRKQTWKRGRYSFDTVVNCDFIWWVACCITHSNAVILNPSFWLVLSRFLLTITTL